MSDRLNHLSEERLHGYVEEGLDAAERAVVDRHLSACTRCRGEVGELRSLFLAFQELPTLAPSAAFADQVMEKVRVRRPAMAWVSEWAGEWASGGARWVERLVPQTTRGWAAVTGLFALPAVTVTVLLWWLLSQPGVTPQSLWLIASSVTGDAVATGWQWAVTQIAGSGAAAYALQLVELIGSVGRGEIGLAVVMFATATAASVYVLYQNLFRTNARRTEHASYVF